LALVLKELIRERAKEKQQKAGGAVRQKSGEAEIRTDKELAKIASEIKIFSGNIKKGLTYSNVFYIILVYLNTLQERSYYERRNSY